MSWKQDWKSLVFIPLVFLGIYFLPLGAPRVENALMEALRLARWYARQHVLLCLVPAFFIAGAIAVFINQGAVMKYLGAQARKTVAYGVASVSGSILAVCSCTVLPLFAGIHRMGAGLGPAVTFLYAGPAINVLAIILTARVLGLGLGVARGVGAVVFSIVIGLVMQMIFRGEERSGVQAAPPQEEAERPLWQNAFYFGSLVGILVFANWGAPADAAGLLRVVSELRWWLTAGCFLLLLAVLTLWFGLGRGRAIVIGAPTLILAALLPQQPEIPFAAAAVLLAVGAATHKGALRAWPESTWSFAKQMLPLLFAGVLVAGFLLGRPGHEGVIPSHWVSGAVGGNSLAANVLASVVGAFMYFATLTEVPILQGLIGSGMGKGPALALLLAGPALSLPNMLVIRSVIGTRKTAVFVVLVVIMATISGMIYGALP
ncbi:MAG: hypothetical protein GF355_06785 [Candidatus Eisenbacteria bacterium]|nr:hypothetical protein [Candidatus Eisenbacteria bacterium]